MSVSFIETAVNLFTNTTNTRDDVPQWTMTNKVTGPTQDMMYHNEQWRIKSLFLFWPALDVSTRALPTCFSRRALRRRWVCSSVKDSATLWVASWILQDKKKTIWGLPQCPASATFLAYAGMTSSRMPKSSIEHVKRASPHTRTGVVRTCSSTFGYRSSQRCTTTCRETHELDVGSTLDLYGSDGAVTIETRRSAKWSLTLE